MARTIGSGATNLPEGALPAQNREETSRDSPPCTPLMTTSTEPCEEGSHKRLTQTAKCKRGIINCWPTTGKGRGVVTLRVIASRSIHRRFASGQRPLRRWLNSPRISDEHEPRVQSKGVGSRGDYRYESCSNRDGSSPHPANFLRAKSPKRPSSIARWASRISRW